MTHPSNTGIEAGQQDDDGAAPLALLRHATAGLETPPDVEQALLAAFVRRHAPLPWHRRLAQAFGRPRLVRGMWAAAVVVLLAGVALLHERDAGTAPASALARNDTFMALEPLERIAREPAPRLVEVDVPRIMFAALGIPVTQQNADQPVRAEMLVAANGEPLAVRLTALH